MGPLLLQRGLLVLHGASVETDDGAIIVAGASGAGKSTVLLELLRRGAQLVSDDVAAITLIDGQPHIEPANIGRLAAWRDTLEYFDVPQEHWTPIRKDLEKYTIPVPGCCRSTAIPVRAIYLLEQSPVEEPLLIQLSGRGAFTRVLAQTRGLRLAESLLSASMFMTRAAVVNHVPVFSLGRPASQGLRVDSLAEVILENSAA